MVTIYGTRAAVNGRGRHHKPLHALFQADPQAWVLPWAILPEVTALLASHVGRKAETLFLQDLAAGAYAVEWGQPGDLERAWELAERHRHIGLVDGTVIAVAERLGAEAIATLDLRDFGAVAIRGHPRLLPRDL